jgi:hypothetical protein
MLTTAAFGASPAVARHNDYVMLGDNGDFQSSKVTVSTSSFAMMSFFNSIIVTVRTSASSVWTGDSVFVLGGSSGSDSTEIDSGTANELGEIGASPSTQLATPMSGQTSTVLGNHVYTVGGTSAPMEDGLFGALLQ